MATNSTGVLLDLDGTLVDSVFHHVLAWDDAFREAGFDVPLWRVHAAIGMGSDRLVSWVLGRTQDDLGDALHRLTGAHERRFLARGGALRPTRGATALLDDLEGRGVPYLIVTSSEGEMTDALVEALGRKELNLLDSDDTSGSKPAPDPILQACRRLGVEAALTTMVGDSPWDAEAATRVGLRAVGLRCGGFSDEALTSAGASVVVDDPADLLGRL
jgi:phosphoglycolate phosphatase-like HAD superfamily hydrolase